MSFIPEIEKQPAPKIKIFQEEKLRSLLMYLHSNSPFYRQLFKKHSIEAPSIKYLENLSHIPPTTKEDIQEHNWDFLCVPRNTIVEYTSTSGTLGKPVTIALTHDDMERLAYNEYISFSCADGTKEDLFQLMLTLDRQFMAGIAYYEGIRKLGAGIVRVGPGSPELQWDSILRYKPTGLVAVPSTLLNLITYAQEKKLNIQDCSVTKAICIGESIRTPELELNSLGQRISDNWNLKLYNTYASTEMQAAFTECHHGMGGHHHPELIIVELLDDDNEPVTDGNPGEIVITTLGVQGMPLLRYKTGDMAMRYAEPCDCGRTTFRISPIVGRKKYMVKFKGTTCYPQGVFDVINQFAGILDYVVEIYHNEVGTDQLRIHLLAAHAANETLSINIKGAFKMALRVVPEIVFSSQEEINTLQEKGISRKLRRVVDNR